VNGEISSLRYGGAYKSYGPQYVRGIQEMDGKPDDGNLWVTYSMNKEDIWISKIPVPVRDKVSSEVDDNFNTLVAGSELNEWNLFSPILCRTAIEKFGATKALALHDADPFDYAKAERVFPAGANKQIEFSLTALQKNFGALEIELVDAKGTPTMRIMLDSAGNILTKQGYRNKSIGKYEANQALNFKINMNTQTRFILSKLMEPSLQPIFALRR